MSERLGWDRGRRRDNGHLGIRLGWDKFKRNPGYVWQDTVVGLRVSTVNGVALIDNAGAVIPTYADGNHSIEIYAAGLMLKGVLSAAGTGETLDAEIVGDVTMGGGWWTEQTGCVIGGGVATYTNATAAGIYKSTIIPTPDGKLFKTVFDVTRTGGEGVNFFISGTKLTTRATNATFTEYHTALAGGNGNINIRGEGAFSGTVDNASVKQVLTPSTAGAVIQVSKTDATQNWGINQWTSASYNLSSYEVKIRAI